MTANSNMSGEDVANRIGVEFKRHGAYIAIPCYNAAVHKNGDKTPSLTIYDGDRGYYCYTCGESGTHSWLLKQYGIEDRQYGMVSKQSQASAPAKKAAPVKKEYKTYDLDTIHAGLPGLPPDAAEVLETKGFGWKTWEDIAGYRWHTSQIPGWPAGVFIPYFKDGKIVTARLRTLQGAARFMSLPGGESFGYLMDNLTKEYAYVCEGESDALTLHFRGHPVVGVPGSTNQEAISKIVAMAAEHRTKLIIIPDNDEAGQKFAQRIRTEAFEHYVAVDEFTVPGFKDVNDWFCASGADAVDMKLARAYGDSIFAPLPPILTQMEFAS